MSILSFIMLMTSIGFVYYIFRSINKNTVLFKHGVLWISVGIVMVVFSFSDRIPNRLARILGFELTSNFLIVIAILFLLVNSFVLAIQLSKKENQINVLIQELSLLKFKNNKEKK